MARTPKRAGVTPVKKTASPAKNTATPAKKTASPAKAAPKTPAKTPARTPRGKQQSPQKTPMPTRKRKVNATEVAVAVADEEIVNKKAKQTPKGRKSLPPKKVEPEIDSEEEEDDELEVNIAAATAGNDSEDDDEDEQESESDDQDEEESDDDDQDEVEFEAEDSGEEESDDDDQDEEQFKDVEVKKEEQNASKQNAKSPEAQIKKRPAKELHETPTVMVRNLRLYVSEMQLKEHFLSCGEIVSCKVDIDRKTRKPKAFIQFKSIADAKCAEATKNAKPFQGWPITVSVIKTAHFFTKENTVVLKNIPKGVPRTVYNEVLLAMSVHGKVAHIKFASNMQSGNVLYKDNTSADAALKAGSFDLMGGKVEITGYGEYIFESPETKVILHGLKADTTEDDVKQAVQQQVVSIYFPRGKKKEELKNQAVVGLKDEASAKNLIVGKTLKVKGAVVDVLPHNQSKAFYNTETGVYFRHPAALFAENIPAGMNHSDINATFEKYGPIQRINMKNHWAIIFFEQKADAQKALKAYAQLENAMLKLHAVDGTYVPNAKPPLAVGRTVYFSNISDSMHITELIKNIKGLKHRYTRIIPDRDPITQRFKHGVFLEFDTFMTAKQILTTSFVVNKKLVTLEMYDPSKHVYEFPENMILVENLDQNTKDVDLFKSFQSFGPIANTDVICSQKVSIGCGYVEFSNVDDAKNALKATDVEINGNKVKIVKPSPEVADKISRKIAVIYKSTAKQHKFRRSIKSVNQHKSRGKFEKSPGKTVQKKTAFKKNGFKKGGFKSPRLSF